MEKAPKMVKREPVERKTKQGVMDRRDIRYQYSAIKNVIFDQKDDIMRVDSDKFNSIMNEVENLHQHVQKPREQVADAEALLDLANTLVAFSKSHRNGDVTPSNFVTALLSNFGPNAAIENVYNGCNVVSWAAVGFAVSQIFRKAAVCCTMIGPMKTEVKQRVSAVCRRMTRPIEIRRPKELAANEEEEKSGTAKIMLIMFEILRKMRSVRLESLVLNRVSFAQTIENIFALSFLVKDGRAEITVNDSGHHLVSPRNAPAASAISSGKVRYHHFVFRFNYEDWELMAEAVENGEELMPHRCHANATAAGNSQAPTTPIRKLSRNRGRVVQEHHIGSCTQEEEQKAPRGDGTVSPMPRKRRLFVD